MNFSTTKPFQVIVLVLFGFLAVLGLILFSRFGGFGSPATKVGSVTIWGTLPQERMEGVLGAIRSGNQEFGGVMYEEFPEESFNADLSEALASGTGPDLILLSQEQLVSEQGKLSVIPYSTLSERDFIDAYVPITELFLSTDGAYAIPLAVDPLVLYYNRTTLTANGIATPPTTWEAVTGLSQRLSQTTAGTVLQSTVPFGVYENVENARAIVSLLLLQAGNPITSVTNQGLGGRLTDTGQGGGSPSQSAMSFYLQFADPVKDVYSWNRALPSARQAFLAGTLAFYPGYASELADLRAANPNLDFDMAPIPQPQTGSTRITYGKVYALAVPKASKNPEGAVKTAFAMADPGFAYSVAGSLGMAPATRVSLAPPAGDRYAPVYYPQVLIARGWLSPSPAEVDRIFSTMINSMTSGRMNLGQALDTANQALNAAF
jgi:multiple sugar transport system substrate-binding protein